MLSLFQIQTIISQCIRRTTGSNEKYVRNKTLAQMKVISPIVLNGFIHKIYYSESIGLPYYHHTLPENAFDEISPDSKLSDVEDAILPASPLPGTVINPVL